MQKEIELIRYVRSNILQVVSGLSIEQLNKIPKNFKNNIAWNLAHLVITQQNMSYKLGGYPLSPEMEWFNEFIPGTLPKRDLTVDDVEHVKRALVSTIDRFELDYHNGEFKGYKSWDLHGVMEINSGEDAAKVTIVHEGRHYGVITSLIKLVI